MSELNISNVFSDGDIVNATKFNTNYSDIVTYVNNRNSGSSAWDAFYMTSATNSAVFDNSTGTQDIAQFKDNGTTVFSINDGGYVNAPYQEFARAYKSADQTVGTSDAVKVTFDTVSQTHSSMDTTGKFTCQSSGKYLISCTLFIPTNLSVVPSAGAPQLMIYKNGTEYSRHNNFEALQDKESYVSDILSLSVGDYIEIYIQALTRNGSPIIQSGTNKTFMSVMKLS